MRNYRENIKSMLEAYRHRRAWKRVTAVLSVIVLLSTFVSLKDYAVAVTAEHELQQQIAAQMQAMPAAPEPAPVIEQVMSAPEVATQEASTPEGTATSSVGSADSFPSRGSSEAGSAEVTGNNLPLEGEVAPQATEEVSSQAAPEAATQEAATAPEAALPNAPEAVEDLTEIPEAPVALGAAPQMMLRAAPHYTPSNISSARPTYLKITDALGNPVGSVMQNDMVTLELRWEVDDATEIQIAGDYIDITLPDGLTYPEMKGTYTASQRIELPGVVIEPGDVIATYEITGNNLHIVHTQNAVDLNQAGQLWPGIQLGALEWMRMKIEGAQATGKGTYDPAVITINGKTAKNPGALIILDREPRKITDVTLTQMLANDASSTTVDYNQSVALSINWSWTGYLRYITSGDYFEIELPTQLVYTGHSRTGTDSNGNEVKSECFIRESDGRWVLRITYVNLYGGYNTVAGFERVMAYPNATLSTGRYTLTSQVSGGISRASAVMNLTQNAGLNGGEWRIRYKLWPGDSQVQNTDYQTNKEDYAVGNGANNTHLFVIANHDDDLEKDPFHDQNTLPYGNRRWYYQNVVDFEPGISNYLDAYCADQGNTSTPAGYYDRYLLTPNQAFRTAGLSVNQVNRLINIMSVGYPYNSLAEMSEALDYDLRQNGIYLAPGQTITQGAAVSAMQQCLWNTIHGYGNGRITVISGADSVYANRVLNALNDYAMRTTPAMGTGTNNTQYRFAQNPTITFNGNTATVSGTVTPAPLPSSFTGTFSNGSQSVGFTVDKNTGRFTATLRGVSKRDTFNLEIDGVVPGETNVYYFVSTSTNHNMGHNQNVISCDKRNRKVNLDWQFNGVFERKVKVVKQWVDKNGNVLTTTPDADVQVTLYRRDKNGAVSTVGTVILNKGNNYTYLWEDLDLTDADGNLYTYYVVETGVPDGYEYVGITPGAEADGATLVFTCKNTPEDTKVKVIKKWEGITDAEKDVLTARVELHRKNADGSTTIMRILNADRTETSSGIILRGDYNTTRGNEVRETLSNANNWTVIFEGLPKYEADGKTLIEYIVKEVGVSNDFTVEITQPDMTRLVPTATVTNTREGSLTVIKKWFNADGTEEWTETLPGGILVKLSAKRNGVGVSDIQLQQLLNGPTQVELNAANGWTYTWPFVHKNGMEYFVTEVSFVRGNQDNYERMDENGNFIAWDTPVSATWNEEKKAFEVAVFNKRKPVEVILIKEDSKDSTKKLEGAAFRLFDETGREVKNANDPQGLYRTDAEGKVVFGSPAGKHLMISQTGNIHRYMLIEEVAPKGYINNQAKISVTFYVKMTDGSPQVVIEKGQTWDNGNGGVMVSEDRAQWMVIRMKNEAVTYTLPETGGIGTSGYTTAGFMLMCMAALFYIVTNQRFTKQFHTNRFVRKK